MNIYTVSVNPAIDLFLDVPEIVFDEVLRATAVRRVWAGKGFNVSRALQRLGGKSTALGFVGGYAGMAIRAGLEAEGIATDFVTVEEETRTNVMIVDLRAGRHIKVNQTGAPVSTAAQEKFRACVRRHLKPGDLWVLTGSLAPGLSMNFYAELIELLHAGGAWAALDTSGAALRAGCAARPELVKPNAAEAYDLTGERVTSMEDACRAVAAFHAAGARRVALSMGAQGLLYSDGETLVHAAPPPVRVRTAVGAGDALLGGLVWALAQGMPSIEVARWGAATGAVYVQDDSLPFDAQPVVRQMIERLQITVLKP
ncbi:1-phosphofructokinase family hexose kinase [Caldilinea sp.]|jgi:1-phosphofructokinase family hexose kinase|uniref:1-phosphofructokinase family hexose kinase n=1 Tax=Caldilinea sp. TaxID=2293560 RepID=UPI0021DD2431|nr:1-phosphofructokinase family hexose kinase [Caldilinea sp.]GIV70031.1 MAG: tagatose-6-phosphate kinase [Caldilinea sp.]